MSKRNAEWCKVLNGNTVRFGMYFSMSQGNDVMIDYMLRRLSCQDKYINLIVTIWDLFMYMCANNLGYFW